MRKQQKRRSALACLWLTLNLSVETWFRFLIWMALGFFIYFGYSHRSARLAKHGHAAEHDDAHDRSRPP